MEHFSPRELCKGNLEGGYFTGDLERYGEEGFRDRYLFTWGSHWGAWKRLIYQGLMC